MRLAGDGFEIVSTDDPLDTDPTGGGGGGGGRFDRAAVVEYVMREAPSAEGAALTLNQIQQGLGARSRPAAEEVKRIARSATFDGILEACKVLRKGQKRDGYAVSSFRDGGAKVRLRQRHTRHSPQGGVPTVQDQQSACGTPMCTGVPLAGCPAGERSGSQSAPYLRGDSAAPKLSLVRGALTVQDGERCARCLGSGDTMMGDTCRQCGGDGTAPPAFLRPGDWELRVAPPRRPRMARRADGRVPFGPVSAWSVCDVAVREVAT